MIGSFGWQDLVAGSLALAALAWLVRRRVKASHRPGGVACDECPACGTAARDEAPRVPARSGLIPVSDLTRRER